MTDRSNGADEPELDPTLEEWLAQAKEAEASEPAGDLDGMLADVEKDIAAADRRPSFWLRTRPTWVRRAIALATAAAVVGVGGVLTLRSDLGQQSPFFVSVALGSLGLLLILSLHQALRPLHRPPLPPAMNGVIVALTLAATFLLALLSPHDAADVGRGLGLHELVSPCLFYGLLLGLPVYLIARLLDRGGGASALLAACASGLAGNLVLQLHCPNDDPEHLMLAHFSVALVFVAGLGLVHLAIRRLRG